MMRKENLHKPFRNYQDVIRVPELYYMKNYKDRLGDQNELLKRYQKAVDFKPFTRIQLHDYKRLPLDKYRKED